ncbi:MAG: hypothetical protein WC841_05495 [Candidatus Shapirobacteria bacterium]
MKKKKIWIFLLLVLLAVVFVVLVGKGGESNCGGESGIKCMI